MPLFAPFRSGTVLAALGLLLAACEAPQEESEPGSVRGDEAAQETVAAEPTPENPTILQEPNDGLLAPSPSPEEIKALKARAPKGRLPDTVKPLSYDMRLIVDPRETHFSGVIAIAAELREAADGIWLHGDGITVNQAVFVQEGIQKLHTASYTQILPTGVSWLGFGQRFEPDKYNFILYYSAPFDTTLAGLFRVEEQGEAYALAKSESIQARKYMLGFDEPGLKAPVGITLVIPEGYQAIANTPVARRRPAQGGLNGMEEVMFEPTRPMSTYLLSLAVGPFDIVEHHPLPANEIRDYEVPLRGVARKGRGGDLGYILGITKDFVEIFERSLGIPYPYKKLDIVAAPQWPSGATELSAAITYREERILAGDNPAPGARRGLTSIHAHEIAHMWFGNLVTPPWWDDLWLKEGFATWGTPLVLSQWEPEGGHDLDAIARSLGAMREDSLGSARRVREPIEVNEDIRNAYTSIPYSKGMALIRMVETSFGAKEFRRALGRYIEAHEDGAADSPQFFKTIGEVTGSPALTEVFESFVTQPGVPLVEASLECKPAGGVVRLKQSRYKPLGSKIGAGQLWAAPVCVTYQDGPGRTRKCITLSEPEGDLDLAPASCPRWIMPNQGGTGYYRWNLTPEGWAALSEGFDALQPGEQLSVADSAMASFESGVSAAGSLLSVWRKVAASPVRQVATAPLSPLSKYLEILEGDEGATALKGFARALYGPVLDGLPDNPDTEGVKLLRTSLESFLALDAEDPELRPRLADKAARFVGLNGEPDPEALNSDEYGMALTVGVQDLGVGFIDKVIGMRGTFDDPRFDGASAAALGKVRDPELAVKMRSYALAGEAGPRERYSIIQGQMGSAATREAAWAWLQENIERVAKAIPAQWRRRLPTLASGFCDTGRIPEVKRFFEANAELMPGYERQLRQAVEQIELCAALKPVLAQDLAGAL